MSTWKRLQRSNMRSDITQLDLVRDDPRMGDPELAQMYREEAARALVSGDTAHFTAKERHDFFMAEAEKYQPNGDVK